MVFWKKPFGGDFLAFLRDEMYDRHVLGADLARAVGISRPQLVNVLMGRFGTTPRVVQALKRWALEGRAAA